MLDSFFLYGSVPANAEFGTFNVSRVLVSYVVAAFASHIALLLAYELTTAQNLREKRALHWGGALAMGAGIWSMHFIGMLAYRMTMVVEYEPWLTLLSFLIAVGAAYSALLIIAREQLSGLQILAAGTVLGFAICGMHYTGMAAMKMDADLRYLPTRFALSVAIAVAASCIAVWLAFTLARRDRPDRPALNIAAALVMGGAISGMHYMGMAAAVFIPFADCRRDPNQTFNTLAAVVIGSTALILLLANAVAAYRVSRARFQLRDSENKLRTIIESALDAIITIDDEGRITEWNAQAERTFGWSRAEALGQQMAAMIVPAAQREAHFTGMQRFLKDGTTTILGRRIEMQAERRYGSNFPVEMAVIARQVNGRCTFTAFIRDISAQKTAEAERDANIRALQVSNRDLDEFAHIVSHDLKEPLRGLHSQASFLLEDLGNQLTPEEGRRLSRMITISERMQQLIDNLLFFSRLGREEMAFQSTDPTEVVRDIAQMLEPFLEERNAKIYVPHATPIIWCDRPRITEVFRNLITNAIKYNDKQQPTVEVGFIRNAITPEGQKADAFYIKDNGVGIAGEFHEEIFRIFKRLNDQAAGEQSGTGAGLTFVKKIIEGHGGRIWLDSEIGKGTTFYFTIPKDRRSGAKRAA
jgi:PAS domain S-box-containing protein